MKTYPLNLNAFELGIVRAVFEMSQRKEELASVLRKIDALIEKFYEPNPVSTSP